MFDFHYQPTSVAVDADYVYGVNPLPGGLVRVSKQALSDLKVASCSGQPGRMNAYGSDLFISAGRKGILKASKQDLEPVVLYAADFLAGEPHVAGVAADEERVYFSTWLEGSHCEGRRLGQAYILSMLKDGSDLKTLVSWPFLIGYVLVDDAFVYWTEPDAGRVMKAPKDGGEPIVIACGQEGPDGIAIDADFVYWTNVDGNSVMKAPK